MTRTIINLREADKRWLDREAKRRRVPMTRLVGEAVSEYRMRQEAQDRPGLETLLTETRGLWRQGDGLAWQERLRNEWDESP
ncbi:MAG: CopG family transcriptional regulator [Wenzhouxiangella sp.]|nr:MAG: CopG family transcriptional regulator [Wenzhouxiangella sp.]